MGYEARIEADSICNGKRLTTFVATYPRFVHSELLTHRMLSRCSSSSRAIPTEKLMRQIREDPAMPVWWGKNQAGMQAREELSGAALNRVKSLWLISRDEALETVDALQTDSLHKQIANRLLEPWMFITVVVSATEWENFFKLRCHPDAQPELQKIAYMMRELYVSQQPVELKPGQWHMPFHYDRASTRYHEQDDFISPEEMRLICVARVARVSYLSHDGQRDPRADHELAGRLAASGHWSPFEHVAKAIGAPDRAGNFIGWRQLRADVDPNFQGW